MKLKTNFTRLMADNSYMYISMVSCAVLHADPMAEVNINHVKEQVIVSVRPSNDEFKQHIIDDLLNIHKLLKIRPTFSSSTAIQKIISFRVSFTA